MNLPLYSDWLVARHLDAVHGDIPHAAFGKHNLCSMFNGPKDRGTKPLSGCRNEIKWPDRHMPTGNSDVGASLSKAAVAPRQNCDHRRTANGNLSWQRDVRRVSIERHDAWSHARWGIDRRCQFISATDQKRKKHRDNG